MIQDELSSEPVAPSTKAAIGIPMRNGYRLRDNAEVELDGEIVTNANLTHDKALKMLSQLPSTFQDVMEKWRYEAEDPYFGPVKKSPDLS